jgi:hypothetical protein
MKVFPETSLEAYKALTPEKLSADYAKIINGLKVLGTATYEQLSDFNGCREPNIISRRMCELERKQLIFKTGEKRLTKRRRNAFVYCLTNNFPKTDNETKLISHPQSKEEIKSTVIQPTLFY